MKIFHPRAARKAVPYVLFALLTGCVAGENAPCPSRQDLSESNRAVTFSTKIIKTTTSTRAYNDSWEKDDKIGVYMLSAGNTVADPYAVTPEVESESTPSPSTTLEPDWNASTLLADNKSYIKSVVGGAFTWADESNTIYWPEDGTAVDFVAYYPYCEQITDFIYPIDLSIQDPQREIDLMWANNNGAKGVKSGSPALEFHHNLTKLIFRVTDLDDFSLEEMVSTIAGLPHSAGFNLATGRLTAPADDASTSFDAVLASTADAATGDGDDDQTKETAVVEAIVLPGEGLSYTLTFTLKSGAKAVFTVESADYEPNMRYIYNITLKSRPEGVNFGGADGELNTIDDWNDTEYENVHELPKNDGTGNERGDEGSNEGGGGSSTDTPGDVFESGDIVDNAAGYTIIDGSGAGVQEEGGYKVMTGQITIQKNDYAGGVESVTLNVSRSPTGAGSLSVKVGGVELLHDDGTNKLPSAAISQASASSYCFEAPAPGEGFPSGDIEIVVTTTKGNCTIHNFVINKQSTN
jgi:hypothetical protein